MQRSAAAGAAKADEPSGSAERRADGRTETTEGLRRAARVANGCRGAKRGGAADAAAATGGHGADAMGDGTAEARG